jgi:hypothetical protein
MILHFNLSRLQFPLATAPFTLLSFAEIMIIATTGLKIKEQVTKRKRLLEAIIILMKLFVCRDCRTHLYLQRVLVLCFITVCLL